jgi:hypothetical protein
MSSVSWTATTSGSWTTAGNWSGDALPGSGDDVTIAVANITVTLGSGDQAINSLTTVGSALDVVGGTLSVASFGNLDGAFNETGGLVQFQGGSNSFTDSVAVGGGTLQLSGSNSFADGLVETAGLIQLLGKIDNFAGAVTLSGGTLTSGANTNFTGAFSQTKGLAQFAGASNNFTSSVNEAGGTLQVTNGFFAASFGETAGVIDLSGSATTLAGIVTQSGGTLAFTAGGSIVNAANGPGTLTQTGGVISVASGTLALNDALNVLAGTISGAGTLLISNGATGTTDLNTGVLLSIGAVSLNSGSLLLNETSVTYAGAFASSVSSTIVLGKTLTLGLTGRSVLEAYVSGQGTITTSGNGVLNGLVLDGPSVLNVKGTSNETGSIIVGNSSGSTAQLDIGKAGRLRITGSDTIYSYSGAGTLNNAGTLVKTAGSGNGTATIIASAVSTGTIAVNTGLLDFVGPSNNFSGALTGGGTIGFGSSNYNVPSSTALSTSVSLTTAHLVLAGLDTLSINPLAAGTLTYAGNWDQTGGTLLLNGSAVLALTGPDALDGGVIKSGTGTIKASGAVTLGNGLDIEGFTTVNLSNTVHQSSTISLGAQSGSLPIATIEAGATWYIEDNSAIDGADGKIQNLGTLEKLNGAGASVLQGTLISSGSLVVASSTLSLNGVGTLGGAITGKGELDINGSYTLDPGTLSVGETFIDGPSASVTLGSNITYGNLWSQQAGTLSLNGFTLGLTGDVTLDGGSVVGPGTITASGAVVLGGGFNLGQSAALDLTGRAEQVSSIIIGIDANSKAQMQIGATGKDVTYTMADSMNITGSGTVAVSAGSTLATGGSNFGSITTSVVDAGAITVNHGTMRFAGPVSGTGDFVVNAGATLDLGSAAEFSNTVSFGTAGGSLFLENPQDFSSIIDGFASGDYIELAGVTLQSSGAALSSNGETLTLSASETLVFGSKQSLSTLIIGTGPHNDLAVFHT